MTGVLSGKTVVASSVGMNHSVALCSDGSVAAWGGNYSGELGNGRTDFFSSTPVSVDMTGVLSGKMVVSVSAGSSHSVALCSDGTVAAWGYNWDGQLGNGTTGYSTGTPMSVNTGTGALWGRTVYALGSDGVGGGCSLALASPAAIAAVEPPMDGGYTAGDTLTFTLTAGVAVTVTGTPRLALTIGTTTRYATYASGSGTTSLVFTYTVQDGERDSDGIAVASVIDLNGGTLTETETWRWPIRLALPAYTLPAIKVELRSLFAALSARAYAGAGEETLIVGFVFAGAGKPTLVRGVGPGMGEAVVGHLVDPQLRLYALDGTPVADNDDWAGSPELSEAFARTGAAALKADSKDAALLAALPGHVYTAHVSGLAGDAGVALAEAYDADLSDGPSSDCAVSALSCRHGRGHRDRRVCDHGRGVEARGGAKRGPRIVGIGGWGAGRPRAPSLETQSRDRRLDDRGRERRLVQHAGDGGLVRIAWHGRADVGFEGCGVGVDAGAGHLHGADAWRGRRDGRRPDGALRGAVKVVSAGRGP